MTMLNAETMHRLAKLALDSGEVSSPEEALELFSSYRLRLHLGSGWAETLAGQACFLTALNTAARAFMGGVEVYGDLSPMLSVPLYEGRLACDVVKELGGEVTNSAISVVPTLVLGSQAKMTMANFCVRLSWDSWCACVTPADSDEYLPCLIDNPLAGVAAASLGVNEAFLHIRGDLPDAGHRTVGLSLWDPLAISDWCAEVNKGVELHYLPKSLWLVGLGHLGQAYAWTLGMLPYSRESRPHLVLQDYDKSTESNISTCMLLSDSDLGTHKVRHVAQRLEAAGFTTNLVERRFGPHHVVYDREPTTALIGVDNIPARRDLDTAGFDLVVEAGLGSGYRDFRNIRTHTFPGPHTPSEIWSAEAAAQAAVDLNEVYQKLANERKDQCGMTQLASRSVATPFIGAMAAVLVCSEVIRPLHGGVTHSVLDMQMRNLRYRNGARMLNNSSTPIGFVEASMLFHTVMLNSA